ncbi:MAG: hypothetical protein Kow0037_20140 [Calditrichia bacterium]
MSPEISVETKDLTRKFGDFVAVNKINISVKKGEIFGFLGANGAGKTTAIRMLCGLLLPSSGEARVAGFDIYQESEQIKSRIGYMSQKFSLYEDLTVAENIQFYGGVYGLPATEIEAKQNSILERFDLQAYRDRLTASLPLGFKQRLALGCAMLHNPDILFLDEPTSGVDPEARREFWEVIHQTAESGTTVFVTTHFMDEAEYCHRISIMSAGQIIALDSPARLKEQIGETSIQKVFLKLLKEREIANENPNRN